MSEETQDNRVVPVNIEEEMKTAYIDYSMSVIVSRALPDVRDGLKPVHRRILYGMNDLGLHANKAHKKSARIVGEVLGKYHPHGDTAVYDAMVRMAQDWSMRYKLVDGQGNFGSVDGDSPAAMRYTEARLQKISADILGDIDKDTVDFRLNFDDSLKEPTVLPSKIPTLLVNGASGIAVGMATNMLPHNLTEVINGTIALIDNSELTSKDLMEYIKAPDFPTGGIMYGTGGVINAYETGRGRVVLRAKTEIEEKANGKSQIIVEELPYQVNKANLISKTAALVNDKKIEGIAAIDDFSDRNGMRIVYDLKRDANPQVVLNNLFKHTALQTSYGINNICLVKGRPELLPLKDLLRHFIDFRHEVVYRRTQFELRKAEDRAHILEGLIIAVDNIDEVIKLIRASKNVEEARNGLMSRFDLSEIQSRAILEMRLQKLTGLEIDKLRAEYDEVMALIARLKEILEKEELRMQIIKDELLEIKDKYGDERKTVITFNDGDINIEDIIDDETAAITISHLGYIKRTSLTEYREQGRGGRGSRGAATRNDDFTENLFIASAHNYLLFFTQKGRCYWLRVYQIPEGTKTSKGRAIQNLISLPPDDKVLATIVVKDLNDEEFLENHNIVFCTKQGIVKKTKLKAYSRPRSNGINAIIIRDGDELLECKLTDGNSDIILASKAGKAIHFHESKAREMGRNSGGVRGIDIRSNPDDELIGMICLTQEEKENYQVLVVSKNGYGKRTAVAEYRETNRGGKGIKAMNITEKTGKLVAIKAVTSDYGLMIINKSGITIRLAVDKISELSRATQGVRLIRINEGDEIASVARILEDEEDTDEESTDVENSSENSEETGATETDETEIKE